MGYMKDSRLPDDWIGRAVAANPIQKIMDPQTGQWTGNVRTCPVRLAFVNIEQRKKPMKRDDGSTGEGKYGVDCLFPVGVDQQIDQVLWPIWYAKARESWPNNFGQDGNPFGLEPWIKFQANKQQYKGFTPGLRYISASTNYKLQVVDHLMNPITDPARLYAGAWALCAVNVYQFPAPGNRAPKKGVGWGLQSVMLIADDERIDGGGGMAPQKAFGGVNVDPSFNAHAAFGQPQQGQQGGQQPGMIPPPPGGAAPGGYPPPATPGYGFMPPPATPHAPPAGAESQEAYLRRMLG